MKTQEQKNIDFLFAGENYSLIFKHPEKLQYLGKKEVKRLLKYANIELEYAKKQCVEMHIANPSQPVEFWQNHNVSFKQSSSIIELIKQFQSKPTKTSPKEEPIFSFDEMFQKPEMFEKIIEMLKMDFQDENDRTIKFGDAYNDFPALFYILTDKEFNFSILKPGFKKKQVINAICNYYKVPIDQQRFEPAKIRNEKKYQKILNLLKPIIKGK